MVAVSLKKKKEEEKRVDTRLEKLIKILIGSLLSKQDLTKKVKKILSGIEGSGGAWKGLVYILENTTEPIEVSDLLLKMPPEIRDVVSEIYMQTEITEVEEDNILDVTIKIARELIRERRTELSKLRDMAEKAGEVDKEKEILLKLRDLGIQENKLFSLDFA